MHHRIALGTTAIALTLALVLTACGQGGPNAPSGGQEQITQTVPTVLILDASGSMSEADAPGPRIDAAKAAARTLIDALPAGATIGLTTYGTGTGNSEAEHAAGCRDVSIAVPLGALDRDRMRREIDALYPSGWTPISLALDTALQQLPDDDSPQAIVLVSDGEDTCGSPPCDAATQAKRSRPGLTISTIGFRTTGLASDQLACIAAVTTGLFVQADNASQLTARLLATQNASVAEKSLTGSGLKDVTIGMTLGEIRQKHPDFPAASTTGDVTVVWVDCDWHFVDGVLISIAPHDGGRTIDGVRTGSSLKRAVELYGRPLASERNSDGTRTVIFDADPNGDTAYRMVVDLYGESGGRFTGVIKSIVLCLCKPGTGAATAGGSGAEPETVVLKPVDTEGNVQSGWTVDNDKRRGSPVDCSFGSASPYDVTDGVRFCGGTADQADACWPKGGGYILCLQDPFGTVLVRMAARGLDDPRKPLEEEPIPLGLLLEDGTKCRARIGGAWDTPVERPELVGWYACDGQRWNAVWGDDEGITKGPDGWTVIVGPSDGHLAEKRVAKAIYVAVA